MSCLAVANVRDALYDAIKERHPEPMELLASFRNEYSYQQIQDAISEMLQNGQIKLGADLHLNVNPAAAH